MHFIRRNRQWWKVLSAKILFFSMYISRYENSMNYYLLQYNWCISLDRSFRILYAKYKNTILASYLSIHIFLLQYLEIRLWYQDWKDGSIRFSVVWCTGTWCRISQISIQREKEVHDILRELSILRIETVFSYCTNNK